MKNTKYITNENNNHVRQKTFFYQGYEFEVNSSYCHDNDMKKLLESQRIPFRDGDAFLDSHLQATISTLVSARETMKNPHTFHIVAGLKEGTTPAKVMERLRRIAPDPVAYVWSLENKNKRTHTYLHIHLFLVIDLPENLHTGRYHYLKKYVEENYNNRLGFSGIHNIKNLGTESKFSKIPTLSSSLTVKNLKDNKEFEEAIKHASYLSKQTTKHQLTGNTFGTSKHNKSIVLDLGDFYRHADFKKTLSIQGISVDLILEFERAGKNVNFLFTFQNWNVPEDVNVLQSFVSCIEKDNITEWLDSLPISSNLEDEVMVSCQVLPFYDQPYRDSQKALRHKYLPVPAIQSIAADLEEALGAVMEVLVKEKLLGTER